MTAVRVQPSTQNLIRAAEVLRRGGLVAIPTDTVYGLAALAFNGAAVERIYAAKKRGPDKAIPVLLASVEEIGRVAVDVGPSALILAHRFWPGPLTIVVPKNPAVPEQVAAETIGIRVPDHTVSLALLSLTGPLAVTSANISGEPSPVTAGEVESQLAGRIDLILDAGVTPGGVPSTVVDCTGKDLKIVRGGPLSLAELQAALY